MSQVKKVVVIGTSGAGAMAAQTVKKLDATIDVTVIREENEKGLLTRCAIPYITSGDVVVDACFKDDEEFHEMGIKLVTMKAVEVNREDKKVVTADGASYPYDKIVLATGASPIIFPIPGIDLAGVFTLRKAGDAVKMSHWINTNRVRNLVVVGAGAIGLETSYLLARKGIKVTIVEMLEHIMQRALDADMSEDVEKYIVKEGIELKLGKTIKAIKGKGSVESVELSSGEKIKAKMVILSGGVRPNIELGEKAGLEVGRLGLKVNEYLQTTDPDIFAPGDIKEYNSFVTGKPTLGQLRPNAVIAGRVAAKNALGHKVKFPGLINCFATKFFDKSIAGAGITESEAKANEIDTISVKQSSVSKHMVMRDKKPYTLKLVFDKKTEKIIGGQIVSDSESPIRHIDLIGLAIRCGLTASDLATLRCAGQPELSADPGLEPIALGSESVFRKFHKLNGTM